MAPKKERLVNPVAEKIDILKYGDNTVFDKGAYTGELSKKEVYHELAKNASRYLSVRGMFEIKNGFNFRLFDESLNPDVNTWKRYDT